MTVKLAPALLNATAVVPATFVPSMVTTVPGGPPVGKKPLIVGGSTTLKMELLVAVPAGVVTLTGPVVAPAGTVAWMAVSELIVKLAPTPWNATAVAPVKFVPSIVTLVPTGPLGGVKLAMVGAAGVGPFASPPSQPMNVKAGLRASMPTSPPG